MILRIGKRGNLLTVSDPAASIIFMDSRGLGGQCSTGWLC
jgi:hypothetical protein